MTFAYSLRFKRCSATRPAGGWALASILVSSHAISSVTDCLSGRLGALTGGISPPRSFRITASQTCASSAIRSGDSVSKARPPILTVLLWQERQFCSITLKGLCCARVCGTAVLTLTSAPQILSKAIAILRLTNMALLIPDCEEAGLNYFSGTEVCPQFPTPKDSATWRVELKAGFFNWETLFFLWRIRPGIARSPASGSPLSAEE